MRKLLLPLLVIISFAARAQDSFLVLSDIHLRMKIGNAWTGKDGDATMDVLTSALDNITAQSNIKAIIIPGDIQPHGDGYKNEGHMSITYNQVLKKLHTKFPGIKIIAAFGNNDCIEDNNVSIESLKLFYSDVIEKENLSTGVPNAQPKEFVKNNGCYAVDIGNIRMIVFNTVPFRDNEKYDNKDRIERELNWLKATLDNSTRKNVWLIYHIPPGVDRFCTHDDTENICHGNRMWSDTVTENSFLHIIAAHQHIIKFQLAGHTHMDDYRIIFNLDKEKKVEMPISYIHIAPALSTKNRNNPAYQVVSYNPINGEVSDVTTYCKPGTSNWKYEYSFRNTFGLKLKEEMFLNMVYDMLRTNVAQFNKFYSADSSYLSPGMQKAFFDDSKLFLPK